MVSWLRVRVRVKPASMVSWLRVRVRVKVRVRPASMVSWLRVRIPSPNVDASLVLDLVVDQVVKRDHRTDLRHRGEGGSMDLGHSGGYVSINASEARESPCIDVMGGDMEVVGVIGYHVLVTY